MQNYGYKHSLRQVLKLAGGSRGAKSYKQDFMKGSYDSKLF